MTDNPRTLSVWDSDLNLSRTLDDEPDSVTRTDSMVSNDTHIFRTSNSRVVVGNLDIVRHDEDLEETGRLTVRDRTSTSGIDIALAGDRIVAAWLRFAQVGTRSLQIPIVDVFDTESSQWTE